MANPATLSSTVASVDASKSRMGDGPSGPRPRKALSPRNIMLYGTLIIVSLYYLLPLYVMLVT